LLLLAAASAVAGAPYIWAIAERRASGRFLTWAWALTGLFDIVFGLAAVGVAVTNQRSHWIGGPAWTIVFALAGATWLLGAPSAFASARR
jgi:hypothetical protein